MYSRSLAYRFNLAQRLVGSTPTFHLCMKVLEHSEVSFQWNDMNTRFWHPRRKPDRSPGIHASDLLRKAAEEMGKLDPEEERDEKMPLRMAIGIMVEEFVASFYPTMNYQPGELEWNGIYGSPDGITSGMSYPGARSKYSTLVEEVKATYKSCRLKGGDEKTHRDITREWLYTQQVMSYINMYSEMMDVDPLECLGRFHIFYIAGAYTYPLEPRYFRYVVQFEEQELKGNRDVLLRYRERMAV